MVSARQKAQERQARREADRKNLTERQQQIQAEHVQKLKEKREKEEKEMIQRSLQRTHQAEETGQRTMKKLRDQRGKKVMRCVSCYAVICQFKKCSWVMLSQTN